MASKGFTAAKYLEAVKKTIPVKISGRVVRMTGALLESQGPPASVGELCLIGNNGMKAEVIGFHANHLLLSPLGKMTEIAPGAPVRATGTRLTVGVGPELLGRVLDGFGQPLMKRVLLRPALNIPLKMLHPIPSFVLALIKHSLWVSGP